MYTPASDRRPPGRSRHRRAQSDPERSYVNPPYVVRWPVPGRTPTPYPHSPSHNSSAERIVDPFVPNSGFFLARHPTSPPHARAPPPTPVSHRSPSPRPGHQRHAPRHGSVRVTQVPLIRDVPQPPRSALNVASVVAAPQPHPVTWGQAPGSVVPQSPPALSQSAGMQRHGSHHAVHQNADEAHQLHHSSSHRHHHHHHHDHPSPSTTHHVVHHRTRPRTRPPTAASHRYATSITQPVYGHGSSTTSNASHTSHNVNGGVASQRHPRMPSPHPPSSISHDHGPDVPSDSPLNKSRSHTHAPSMSGSIAPPHSMHRLDKMPLAAGDIHRHTDRPAVPANYDGQTQTRYVSMLLALDDISPLFNALSAFFTWILLAGFVLLPSTFASLRNEPAGSAQSFILTVINHVSLFAIALACAGVGVCGMIWLWWRWHGNYIWITNRIFVPGCLNSMAGLISTLANIYGVQGGELGRTEESAVIITSLVSVICGTLFVVYEHWFIRNLRLEHDQEVGVELAGKHGAGVLEEKRDEQDTRA